jgi:electron transfer flavoprotein alpha subunit
MSNMTNSVRKQIFIVAEHNEKVAKQALFELCACARKIQEIHPAEILILVLGNETDKFSFEIARMTGMDVISIDINELALYNAEIYKKIIENLAAEFSPSFIIAGHTTRGLDFASALAIRMKAACITAVEDLNEEGGNICFRRQICYGKINAYIAAAAERVIITVQPGAFLPYKTDKTDPGKVEKRKVCCVPESIRAKGIISRKLKDSSISEAKVIISAGNGIGEKENLDLIFRLADIFPGSAVGSSRILVDRGWVEYRRQIGITGAHVTPDLYVACGISGASQHLAGMRDSGFVVAINRDPKASIFNESDVCVIEDLNTFIPVFIEEYGKTEI